MTRFILTFCLGVLASLHCNASIRTAASVEVVADLLEAFQPSFARDSSESAVRRPASAGKIKQNGLFQHPRTVGRPARIDYQLDLPAVLTNDLVLLAFDIAIADGIQSGKGADGVRFGIELEGQQLFAREWSECRWESHALDLTPHAGRKVHLALLVDAMKNTSYDWATWGSPRILCFRDAGFPNRVMISESGRVVAVRGTPSSKLKVKLKGTREDVEWTLPAVTSAPDQQAWLVKDLPFADANGFAFGWASQDAAPAIWVGSYPPQLRLLQVAAARAVITAGDSVPVRVTIKNEGRGRLPPEDGRISLKAGEEMLPPKTLPPLAPNETWQTEWIWRAPASNGIIGLKTRLTSLTAADFASVKEAKFEVFDKPAAIRTLQNDHLKLDFVRAPDGFAYANVSARQDGSWAQVAVWRPLFTVVSDFQGGEQNWEIRPADVQQFNESSIQRLEFTSTARDADNVEWRAKLRVTLPADQAAAQVRYEWATSAPRSIRALWGPNLYVGDGSSGEAKSWGLFPGLEYLHGPERSSNPRDFAPPLDDRRTPHPHKITVPLMAVSVGLNSPSPPENPPRFFTPDSLKDQTDPAMPNRKSEIANLKSDITVALLWNPHQRWDGEHAFPAARFASPNFDEGMRNHRLGLFLPSAPDFVRENADRAEKPYSLSAGKTLTLDASLLVTPGPAMAALREWLHQSGGLPKPNPWPRTFQDQLTLCRTGFLKTVWDSPSEKWRHCIGWAPSHAPGFAALLWLDSQLAESPGARRDSSERVELAAKNMLRDGGPGSFTSQANCHIMQWEFPFLYGHLPEALTAVERQVQHLVESQRDDGGWIYQPGNEQQADLGRAGDSVLGTCANRAATLLRYARITGDTAALAAGEKALRFMERFRVPRGGQTWECPMYEPDILAAAYAIRAYYDAFRATGNPRWLHNAVSWAETGVPFVYLWTLPDRPMMLGSTIPVFGSTFYTHTWLGVPVQWCGLVYAYHVFHLAQELERTALSKNDSPLPLALDFLPTDWKRLVELITVSAAYQQFAEGERIGSYPDSISNFERRNPAFINPEDILVNVLALEGYDPDIKTALLRTDAARVIVSSGAQIGQLRRTDAGAAFELKFFAGEKSRSLIASSKPRQITVNDVPLRESGNPVQREAGWWWDASRARVYLTILHEQPNVHVQLVE